MPNQFTKACYIFFLCGTVGIQACRSETNAKIEIIEPFATWFLKEQVDFFVRITNTGNEPLSFSRISAAQRDLFFEVGPNVKNAYGELVFLPNVANAKTNEIKGMTIPPGRAYVLSDLDYNERGLDCSECFTRARIHFLIEPGKWVSSEWTERKILPDPNLNVASLYEYVLDPAFKDSPCKILPLKVGDETWLFSHSSGDERVGRRLCRVPKGMEPSSFQYDPKTRRLTIVFNGNEEPVVINTRTGRPLSGSERTVPHLHLWKRIAGRPFTDFWQELTEQYQGKTIERDRMMTTVPAIMEQSKDAPSRLSASDREANEGQRKTNRSDAGSLNIAEEQRARRSWWLFMLAGVFLLTLGLIFFLKWCSRSR